MKKPGKGLVLTLNLALPGLGQIVSGRWLAGGVMMLLAVAFFLLGVYFVFAPLFAMIRELIDDPGSAAEYRSKPLCTFGECASPAGRKKPMQKPTISVTASPGRLKPTASALG